MNLEQAVIKHEAEQDHLFFTRYFFFQRQNNKFRVNFHHHIIADALQKVIDGEIKNLVINVSPGSSKTELAVINFIARGLALNPRARFMHLSYSDDLALLNSQTARDIIRTDEYQTLWPLAIADDTNAKKRWNVMLNGVKAGGVYATSMSGQVTGFRAGLMESGFTGALIIDDPLKPEDAFSKTKLETANRELLTTVQSRLANPDVPVILIMQRLAENDCTGFIQQGNLGKDWTHIVIPAVIDDEYIAKLEPKYQDVIEPGADRRSYWPYKEPIERLLEMESGMGSNQNGSRISKFVFSSQYQQAPKAVGGNIIHGKHFVRYKIPPKFKYRKIYADTAQKTGERNDYSVFECWGYGEDGKIYLIDLLRGKYEAPELERRCNEIWNKHKAPIGDFHASNPATKKSALEKWGQLREMLVEDKSSGTGLIQKIKSSGGIPIKGIERVKDKLTRVMDILGYIEAGMVCIPEDAAFTSDFITECEAFTADDSHAFDDQVDPLVDAINDMLGKGNVAETWKKAFG